MTAKRISQVFEDYHKARLSFVQNVARLSARPHNIDLLHDAGILDLLHPLLADVKTGVKQAAVTTLGKLAACSQTLAEEIIRRNMLQDLLTSLHAGHKFHKTAVLHLLRVMSSYSPETAEVVVQTGALGKLVACLEDFEPSVKVASCWAISNIARHHRTLAEAVVDAGAVPLLAMSLQEPELCLKQAAASALCDIAKHTKELAKLVVDAGSVALLARAIANPDPKIKRQIFAALGNIAKHSVELAEIVVEAEVFPDVLKHLAHPDEAVAKNASILVSEVAKHSLELCEFLVNMGAIGALVQSIGGMRSDVQMYGIMSLGYMAAHSGQLAVAIIESQCGTDLSLLLDKDTEDHILAAAVWTLGHIGKHTPRHAQSLADASVFTKVLQLFLNPKSSEDLKQKCHDTLKLVLQKCINISALEPLISSAPPDILKYIVGQFSKILPNDAKARRLFVATGGLRKIQEIHADAGTTLMEYITIINCCFPEDIVRYYSPGHEERLLDIVEQYQPEIPCDDGQAEENGNSV